MIQYAILTAALSIALLAGVAPVTDDITNALAKIAVQLEVSYSGRGDVQ